MVVIQSADCTSYSWIWCFSLNWRAINYRRWSHYINPIGIIALLVVLTLFMPKMHLWYWRRFWNSIPILVSVTECNFWPHYLVVKDCSSWWQMSMAINTSSCPITALCWLLKNEVVLMSHSDAVTVRRFPSCCWLSGLPIRCDGRYREKLLWYPIPPRSSSLCIW